MYKNRWKNRWEATQPEHLIGWTIVSVTTERSGNLFKMNLVSTSGKNESRECWVDIDIVPSETVQRNYNK